MNVKEIMLYSDIHKVIDGEINKKCSDCKQWFPMNSEYFYKNSSNKKDGYNTYCKECTKFRSAKWQQDNYERYRKGFIERSRKKRQIPEKAEYHRVKAREQRESGYLKIYQRNNPEKMKKYRLKYQNKKHDIANNEWENCKAYFDYSCAYCGISEEEAYDTYQQRFHKEHVDHYGANDLSNCVPACKGCNSKKWKYEFDEWYNSNNEIYSKQRYNRIIRWLNNDYKKYINNEGDQIEGVSNTLHR